MDVVMGMRIPVLLMFMFIEDMNLDFSISTVKPELWVLSSFG